MNGFDSLILLTGILQSGTGFLQSGFGLVEPGLLFAVFQAHDQIIGGNGIIHIKGQLHHRTAGLGGYGTLLNRFNNTIKMGGFLQSRPCYRLRFQVLSR